MSDEATAFGVSDATLNRALAWAWAVVCSEVTEVSTNRSQVTQLLSRIALFTDAFQGALASSPVTRRSGAAAPTGGRSAASRAAEAEAATGAAAPPRAYATPPGVDNLLEGYEVVGPVEDGGGADGGGDQAGPDGGRTGGDEERQQPNATGGADPGAVAPRAPESPGRNERIRARIAQTPGGHTNLRHMPALRAALGREHLSFSEVSSLSLVPPGHVINIPQGPGDSLTLALEAEASAAGLLTDDGVSLVRSLRPAGRLKGLFGIMRAAHDEHELRAQATREDDAARCVTDRVRRLSFTQALAGTRDAGIRTPRPPERR